MLPFCIIPLLSFILIIKPWRSLQILGAIIRISMLLLRIFSVLLLLMVLVFSGWIPGTFNQKADYYSKIVDFDDSWVSNDYIRKIDSQWGHFTIDCFASYANTKLTRFYSRFYSPNTLGVDALSHRWEGENCWLPPPVSLVTQVIEHFKLCKCVGALVVPYCLSAIFLAVHY